MKKARVDYLSICLSWLLKISMFSTLFVFFVLRNSSALNGKYSNKQPKCAFFLRGKTVTLRGVWDGLWQ